MKPISASIVSLALLAAPAAVAVEWTFNGFATAGGGTLSVDGTDYAGYDGDVSLEPDSVLGGQVTAQLTERLSGTVQLVARGSNDFEPEVEWAYASFQLTDDLMVRAGRLRPPFFIVSDYLDVAYAYPWIRPPQEIYRNVPLTNYDGGDVVYSRSFGDWFTSFQVYAGSEEGTQIFSGQVADRELDGLKGVAVTTTRDALTLRASWHEADVSFSTAGTRQLMATLAAVGFGPVAEQLNSDAKATTFTEVAFVYDRDQWFVRGEATRTDYSRSFIADQKSWYVSAGMRFGDFVPYVTYSQVDAQNDTDFSDPIPVGLDPALDVLHFTVDAVATSADRQDQAITAGTRWDLFSRTALKFEYTRVESDLGAENDYGLLSVALNVLF